MSSGVGFPHSAENPRRLPHNDGPPPTPAHSAPLWLVFSRPRVCFPFALIHSRLRRPPGRPTSFFAHTVFMRVMCTPFFRVQRVQITFHLPSSAFICLHLPSMSTFFVDIVDNDLPGGYPHTFAHLFGSVCIVCRGERYALLRIMRKSPPAAPRAREPKKLSFVSGSQKEKEVGLPDSPRPWY